MVEASLCSAAGLGPSRHVKVFVIVCFYHNPAKKASQKVSSNVSGPRGGSGELQWFSRSVHRHSVHWKINTTSAVPVGNMYSYREVGGSFFMDGQMRLCLKVRRQGCLGLL